MRIIARGYTHWDPIIAPDPVCVVTLSSMADFDSLQEARRDLWWTREFVQETRRNRVLGYAVAVVALLAVLGIAGWIEGLS